MDMRVDREFVRRLRLDKSWSQEKLADEAGVSLRTVQRVEADGVAAHRSCRAIAKALGVDPAELRHRGASNPQPMTQSARALEIASPWGFALLRTAQTLLVSVLWLLMALRAHAWREEQNRRLRHGDGGLTDTARSGLRGPADRCGALSAHMP